MGRVPAKAKFKIRLVSDLVSEEDRFYVMVWPIVDIKADLTDNDRKRIAEEVKKDLAKELNK